MRIIKLGDKIKIKDIIGTVIDVNSDTSPKMFILEDPVMMITKNTAALRILRYDEFADTLSGFMRQVTFLTDEEFDELAIVKKLTIGNTTLARLNNF